MGRNVCICSVIEADNFADYRFIAQNVCDSLNLKPNLNNEDKGQTQAAFERILREEKPIVILLMGQKSSETVKNECKIAIQNGLKILGCMKISSDGTIPKEVQNNVIAISKTLFDKDCIKFKNCRDLHDELKGRLEKIVETQHSVDIGFTTDNTYSVTAELVSTAKNRIAFFQHTSSLILGPRRNKSIEKDYYDRLIERLKMKEETIIFTHVFSKKETVNELKNKANEYLNIEKAKQTLESLLNDDDIKNNIIIRISDYFNPCAIIDDNVILDFILGDKKCYTILRDDITIHNQVELIIEELSNVGKLVFPENKRNFDKIFDIYKEVGL